MNKKITSFLVALALFLGILPVGILTADAYSETDVAYPVEGGNIYFEKATGTITDCDQSVTSANIPAKIDGAAVVCIGDSAFYQSGLTSVSIPDSVTIIGESAFAATNLSSVTIPDSVVTIGNYAFMGCESLSNVTIGNGISAISDGAFKNCRNLTSVKFGDNITHIGYCAFSACGFTSMTIPEGVMHIGTWAFWICEDLTSVELPDSLCTIGAAAFQSCGNLRNINIPENVNSVGAGVLFLTAFSADKSNWQNDVLYLDKWLLETSETGLLGNYEILEGTIGIAGNAFQWSGLTSVTIPSSVRNIGECAFEDSDVTGIWVDPENEHYSSDEQGFLFNKEKTILIQCPGSYSGSYIVPNGVEDIGFRAFALCDGLTDITMPKSVTNIGRGAFYCCDGLTGAYFKGDAPAMGDLAFDTYWHGGDYPIEGLTLYYVEGKAGWTSPTWNGYPTATWEPPHEHEYTAVVTAPTCIERGYTTYTCACGDSYLADYVDALGHDYKDGSCTRCGQADPDYKPPVEFKDVAENAWYKDAVDYAVANGLMNGTGNNKFEPESPMTRAMLVTVLWRYAGEPARGENTFSDVKDGVWYAKAVAWAADNGIVGGIGNGKFDPDGKITREQMAAILYRYCNSVGIDTAKRTELSGFPDGNKVSAYATDALSWAVAEGLIAGSKVGGKVYLEPQGNATRAQVATILMRFIENVVK